LLILLLLLLLLSFLPEHISFPGRVEWFRLPRYLAAEPVGGIIIIIILVVIIIFNGIILINIIIFIGVCSTDLRLDTSTSGLKHAHTSLQET
jgi:hypothetical protein